MLFLYTASTKALAVIAMIATRNNLSLTFIMITLYSHCGYAQYMKEFVGPLSLLPPLDKELDRGKVENDYRKLAALYATDTWS